MPTMPSGRRIEFSLDRFHAMLEMLPEPSLKAIADSLGEPEDLLWVLDLISFDQVGRPHFAECVAADWPLISIDWHPDDRDALERYMYSEAARLCFERGLKGTQSLLLGRLQGDRQQSVAQRLVA